MSIETIQVLETDCGVVFGQIEDGLFRVEMYGDAKLENRPSLSAMFGGEAVERMFVDALLRQKKDAEMRRKLLDLVGDGDE